VGVQEGLKEIQIINGITVKPDEDIFKKVIEERIRIKKRMGEIEASNPEYKKNQEWNTLNSTQAGLKTIANSGAYGIFLQLNPEPTEALVDVYGLTHIKSQVDKLEVPGPMFNPIIGIFQTAGARLMLAAVEALLDQHGGYYAGCDTDSMFVSPQHAQMIQDFFQPLNPYDEDVLVFKIETDDEKKPLIYVWYYGISAKRYVLYDLDPSTGGIKIRKYSSHGLGQLNLEEEEWWTDILTVHYHPDKMEDVLDKYSDRVAAHQMTITKYDLWRHFDGINQGKPVSEMIKPFNFITVGTWRQRHPKTGEPIIPTTPFVSPDSEKFELLPYGPFIDKKTGDVYTNPPTDGRLETQYYWNDMAGVFERYIDHPESKSEGDIGLLERRHMYVGKDSTHYIGKESDDLEETIMEGDD
jgi:hypothetical protein